MIKNSFWVKYLKIVAWIDTVGTFILGILIGITVGDELGSELIGLLICFVSFGISFLPLALINIFLGMTEDVHEIKLSISNKKEITDQV